MLCRVCRGLICRKGSHEAVKLLLEHGGKAVLKDVNKRGLTSLGEAMIGGHFSSGLTLHEVPSLSIWPLQGICLLNRLSQGYLTIYITTKIFSLQAGASLKKSAIIWPLLHILVVMKIPSSLQLYLDWEGNVNGEQITFSVPFATSRLHQQRFALGCLNRS